MSSNMRMYLDLKTGEGLQRILQGFYRSYVPPIAPTVVPNGFLASALVMGLMTYFPFSGLVRPSSI